MYGVWNNYAIEYHQKKKKNVKEQTTIIGRDAGAGEMARWLEALIALPEEVRFPATTW